MSFRRQTPYDPLTTPDSVRILRLQRDTDRSISGELQAISLDSKDYPPFTALSYTWGAPTKSRSITLDGLSFPVLDSLYPVLEAICRPSGGFEAKAWYWIDSICIDQTNSDERGAQVQLMGRLFATAWRTAVWLCPATAETDAAVALMARLSDVRDTAGPQPDKGLALVATGKLSPPPWAAWAALLELPWWRRAWTLQEFVMARRLDFHCGALKRFSLTQFRRAMTTYWGLHHSTVNPTLGIVADQEFWVTAWNRRRMRQVYDESPGRMNLIALMAYTGDSAVTNPRDRVYSVLGLATEADQIMVGVPTYRLDVETLYTNLVREFIKTWSSLDIICFAELFGFPERGSGSLPSWVPDWRVQIQIYEVPLLVSQSARKHIGNFRPARGRSDPPNPVVYAATGDVPPRFSISRDGRQLICSGIVLDYIDSVGPVPGQEEDPSLGLIQSTSPANNLKPADTHWQQPNIDELINSLIRCMTVNRHDRYLCVETPMDKFRDEFFHLSASTVQTSDRNPSICYDWFFRWLQASAGLLIRGMEIHDYISRASKFQTAAEPPIDFEAPAPQNGLASRLFDTTAPHQMRKRLVTTEGGQLGMGPRWAKKGDVVCVLYGCQVPVVLRRARMGFFEFVGECYVDGMMNGEAALLGREARDLVVV
ncbi:heterokaryon incompatibility protein-domain-containing protein [Schizothecium vesticola]|uniref:Heterokaryon incompatibility protein-domain-containing protein n=1 Tax=Schizothecium vesticola TaxID=314040 RepID=A0AA40EIL6_9PEZI|nr:heterokaryon incompatibility protein-domain-containing protein [Schizothecium vesticola]